MVPEEPERKNPNAIKFTGAGGAVEAWPSHSLCNCPCMFDTSQTCILETRRLWCQECCMAYCYLSDSSGYRGSRYELLSGKNRCSFFVFCAVCKMASELGGQRFLTQSQCRPAGNTDTVSSPCTPCVGLECGCSHLLVCHELPDRHACLHRVDAIHVYSACCQTAVQLTHSC